MFTAVYLANRTPHSALHMGITYNALDGEKVTLQPQDHRVQGVRTHRNTHKSSRTGLGKGSFVGTVRMLR